MNIQDLRDTGNPFVLVDQKAKVLEINQAFTDAFGWSDELVGQSMKAFLPPDMAISHDLCFARFRHSEGSQILGHPLELSTLRRDGSQVVCAHFIVAENTDGVLTLGATITPLSAREDTGQS
jgi:PAS domain S-box-containing protein